MNPSVDDDPSLSFGNLVLYDSRTAGAGNATPLIGNNGSASAPDASGSLPRTHQVGLPPLYSHNIREAGHGTISRRDFLGSNLPYGATSVMPYSNFSGNAMVSNAYVSNVAGDNLSMLISYVRGMRVLSGLTFLRAALTEQGSMQLQRMLMSNPETIARAVNIVMETLDNGIPIIYFLMVDGYGCQVVSRIIYACNQQQLAEIVYKITWDCSLFVNTVLNKNGSNLVKNLIDILKQSPLVYKIVSNLSMEFYKAMIERHGSDVIRHCIRVLDHEQNKPLYEEATRNCFALAIHKQGCVALNEFITAAEVQHITQLLQFISNNVVFLSHDDFGNFVVQNVLGLEIDMFTVEISSKLKGFYANLSMQQSGSHVVERILRSPGGMSYAVGDLIDSRQLLQVTQHRYGNYVIQTALKVSKQANSPLYLRLLNRLQPYYSEIQSGFGKNVYNLIMRLTKCDSIIS